MRALVLDVGYVGVLLAYDDAMAKVEAEKLRKVWPKGYQSINNREQNIFVIHHKEGEARLTLDRASEALNRRAVDRSSIAVSTDSKRF